MISVRFKHRKSNFFVSCSSKIDKDYFRQYTIGNMIEYDDFSSKNQKTKHAAEQLAVIIANSVNHFFHIDNLLHFPRSDYRLHQLYTKLGLIDSYVYLLTNNASREKYLAIQKAKAKKLRLSKKRSKVFFRGTVIRNKKLDRYPPLLSLYLISCTPHKNKTHQLIRVGRIRKKYKKIQGRKRFAEFNARLAKTIHRRWVIRKRKPIVW